MTIRVTSVAILLACATAGMWSGCSRRDPSDAEGRRTLRVTGIPDENPTELARKYDPMVEYLEARLGTRVEYVPVTDYGAAVQALAAGKVDFAWLGGFTHVQARVMAGAIPLCMRDIDREFKTVFIANRASGIASPTDLEDKTFAFGAKSSTSGHLMARHFLVTRFHMDPEKDLQGNPVYSGAHDATVKLVESGKVQAGALNIEVWDRMVRDKQVDTTAVAVIWTTPPYVDYVWTANRDVPVAQRDAFRRAFLDLDATKPEHAAVLALQGATKFVLAQPSDFDSIEQVARGVGLLKP